MTVSLRLYNSLDFAHMSVYADFAVVFSFQASSQLKVLGS